MERAEYVHAGKEVGAERRRLQLLAAALDPETFDVVDRLGDLNGTRCLEVGAGTGSVAAWLAGRVGPTGSVTATDIDLTHVGDLPPNVEVRQHDLTADDFEGGPFHLVHCRAVLVHLPDPAEGLRRLAGAVSPGGFLVVEEPDQTAFGAADPRHPAAATFDRVLHAMLRALQASGRSDQYFGRRVPTLVREAGLVEVANEVTASIEVGGSTFARVLGAGAPDLWAAVGATLDIGPDEVAVAIGAFDDPTFSFVRLPMVRAWGRRPPS